MKLNQISARKPPNDASYKPNLTQIVINKLMASHPIFSLLEFYAFDGNADTPRKRGGAAQGAFRAVGAEYTPDTATPAFGTLSLKIYGFEFQVDQAHIRRSIDINGYILQELEARAEDSAPDFIEQLMQADGSGNAFTGILGHIVAGQKHEVATNGDTLPTGTTTADITKQDNFFKTFDKAIDTCRGPQKFACLNAVMMSKVTILAGRRHNLRWEKSDLGMDIPYYRGVPLLNMEYDSAGNLILPYSETQGTSSDCTSVVIVNPGTKSKLTIGSNTGINVYDEKEGVNRNITCEGDFDMDLLDDKSLSAVTGIRVDS